MRPNPASKLIGSLLPPEARRRVSDALSGINTGATEMPAGGAGDGCAENFEATSSALQELLGGDLSSWLA